MKKIILIIIILLKAGFMYAQGDTMKMPKFIFKINPLQLIDGEVRLLMEKSIKNRHAIEFVGSYYLNISFWETEDWENQFLNRKGFKAGIGIRHYFGRKNFYINPNFFFKYMGYEWATANVADGLQGGAALWNLFFNRGNTHSSAGEGYIRKVYALQLQIGRVNYKNDNNKYNCIESYCGIGVRYKSRIRKINSDTENYFMPALYIGFNINFY